MVDLGSQVSPIRQPNLNDCWATCCAMVLGLRGPSAVEEVRRRAVAGHVRLVVFGYQAGSCPSDQVPALASALNLRFLNVRQPPQPVSLEILRQVMASGPAAAFGEYNYPGAPTSRMHVLLICRAQGPDQNPMISLVDPYHGRRLDFRMAEINESLGSVDYYLYR